MWVKLDDGYTEHPKLMEAARQLGGRSGYARALAIDLQGLCYANRTESDGFLPEIVVKSFHDPRPLDVAFVLVQARRWHRVTGGYQIHDYEVYQPLAADLKRKRAADLERKKRKKGAALPVAVCADSARNPSSPDPDPGTPVQDHGRAARAGCGNPVENRRVLKALIWREVHAAYADREPWDEANIAARVKDVAARAGIDYGADYQAFREQIAVAMRRVPFQRGGRAA